MNGLSEIIMAEHSRAQADFIADIIIKQPSLIDELVDIVFQNIEPVSRRAAWPLRIISDRKIEMVNPFIPSIIQKLTEIDNISIHRSFLAILVNADIPENLHGELLQITSEILLDRGSPVASLIYSADIFYKLTVNEPDLLNELKLMLEEIEPYGTAGVKSKSRHIIKRINKRIGMA